MTSSRFNSRSFALAILALSGAALPSLAQGEPADDNTPVVPDTPFPSIIALDQGDSVWTLKVSNGTLDVNGDVTVNSSNRGAIWMADGAIQDRNGRVRVVGGVSRLGKTTIKPNVDLGGQVATDPLPEFRVPAPENLMSREKLFLNTEEGGDDTVLSPGIYNGGIFASGKGHITLQPGTFIITGGDFSVIGPTVEGEGVTLVMAGDKPGALSFSLGATFNASAPTKGKLKDLLVVSRASGTRVSGVSFAVASGHLKGIVYAPNSSVSLSSQSDVQVSKIIAQSVDVTSSHLNVTGSEAAGAAPTEAITLPKVIR